MEIGTFEKLTEILEDIRTVSRTCVVWKRSALCITESRAKPDFFMHNCQYCEHIKDNYGTNLCRHHDSVTVPRAVEQHGGEPFLLNCPGGATELIVPVRTPECFYGVLFIGPFASGNLRNQEDLPSITEPQAASLGRLCRQLLLPLGPQLSGMHPDINPHDQRIAQVIRYIEQHYNEKITLAAMAKRFFLSPSRFSHLFVSQCGQSFTEFLMNTRLMVSMDLLRFSDRSIAEIAHLCGFSDAGHFATLFKNKFSHQPSFFRKFCSR